MRGEGKAALSTTFQLDGWASPPALTAIPFDRSCTGEVPRCAVGCQSRREGTPAEVAQEAAMRGSCHRKGIVGKTVKRHFPEGVYVENGADSDRRYVIFCVTENRPRRRFVPPNILQVVCHCMPTKDAGSRSGFPGRGLEVSSATQIPKNNWEY